MFQTQALKFNYIFVNYSIVNNQLKNKMFGANN